MSATEVTAARKYLAAYTAQGGTSAPVACPMAYNFRFLPDAAFTGIPAGTCWVEAGRIAALWVLS